MIGRGLRDAFFLWEGSFSLRGLVSQALLRPLPFNYSNSLTCLSTLRMLFEEQRFLHEDLERLEQGISDRVAEDPRHVSRSLGRRLFQV